MVYSQLVSDSTKDKGASMFKMIARVTFVLAFLLGISTGALGDPLLTFFKNEAGGSASDLHLYFLDVGAGGEFVDITPPDADGGSPAWSPDGGRIIFSSMKDGDPDFNVDLYTVDRNGENLQKITDTPTWEDDPAWSPDGQRIAYGIGDPGKERSVWVLDLNSGVERELVPLGGEIFIKRTRFVWSPDGKQIAFNAIGAGNVWGIYTVHVDTKQLDLLQKSLGATVVQGWLPTGGLLVIQFGGEHSRFGILTPNGEFELLFPEVQEKLEIDEARATWRRPDLFVFSATSRGELGQRYDTYRVTRRGTGLQQLTFGGTWGSGFDLYTDSLDVPTPAEKLATSWAEVKAGRVR
ncbi:MAG: hypothetical protein Q8P01_01070 [bacterium]|nr:hypothetical protein [bacterium]